MKVPFIAEYSIRVSQIVSQQNTADNRIALLKPLTHNTHNLNIPYPPPYKSVKEHILAQRKKL